MPLTGDNNSPSLLSRGLGNPVRFSVSDVAIKNWTYFEYQRLKNLLRRCHLIHILALAYHFTQHSQFGMPIAKKYTDENPRQSFAIERFAYLLDTLAREAILNCQLPGRLEPSGLMGVRQLLDMIHKLEDSLWEQFSTDGDILYEILRKAHRQFPWQTRIEQDDWFRYFKIYSHPSLCPLVEEKFGMSVRELYQIGMAIFGHFLESPISTLKWDNFINDVADERIGSFFERFSIGLPDAKAIAIERETLDINWAYNLSPLHDFPILRFDQLNSMVCPVPTLLSWRLTDGLYFEIVSDSDIFRRSYGAAFESYVGEVLSAANRHESYHVIGAQSYGGRSRRKESVDWIAEDETGSLFIEVKAHRLKVARKLDLRTRDSINAGLLQLADFVCQVYRTLSHALEGRYPHWKPNSKPVYPIIVTLDDWNAIGPLVERIDEAVRSNLELAGLDISILLDHPYTVCAIQDFEDAIQIMANIGIRPFMDAKVKLSNRRSLFAGFILENYASERREFVTDLFPNTWNEIDPRL